MVHELAIDDLGKQLVIVDVANPAGKYLYTQGGFVAIGGPSSREQQPDIAVHSIPCDRKRRLDVLAEVRRKYPNSIFLRAQSESCKDRTTLICLLPEHTN